MNEQQSKLVYISMYSMFLMAILLSFVFSMMDSRRIAILEGKVDKIAKNLDAVENSILVLLQDEKERLIKQQESK